MADLNCFAIVRGLGENSPVKEFAVRAGPGTNYTQLTTAPVGLSGLRVLEVLRDEQGTSQAGKVHQWFKLAFPDGTAGWIRDHALAIYGDCTEFGYGIVSAPAFSLTRNEGQGQPPAQGLERVKKASYAITAAFEGGSYAAYNNFDAGIVSYGLFQFTLASSSLERVLQTYWATASGRVADALRTDYEQRVKDKDPTLRDDDRFRNLLVKAADETEMREAQSAIVTEQYWDVVYEGYVKPRELRLPLSLALLFDMGINFGTGHGFVRQAEKDLGVPSRSKPGQNGITEEQLTSRVAELRRQSHYRQAERDNLPGLKVRGDFWVNLVRRGDWDLQGDANGNVNVNGRFVQVRNP